MKEMLNIEIPTELKRAARIAAAMKNRSLSAHVRELIRKDADHAGVPVLAVTQNEGAAE